VRQQAAIQLIGWLTDPDNLAVWSQEAGYVPARRSALAAWSGNDDYFAFLDAQLTLAQPYPVTATGPIQDALAIALFDVISLARTPGAAAEEALQRLRP
jgi:ABC-type glycerol-3-phosphate transport system substrate-binding protein